MWRFPEIGIPPNHPFVDGTPIYGKPIPSLQDEPRSYQAVFASLGNNWSWPGNRKWQVDNAPFSFIIFPYVYIYTYIHIYMHTHTHICIYVYRCPYIADFPCLITGAKGWLQEPVTARASEGASQAQNEWIHF